MVLEPLGGGGSPGVRVCVGVQACVSCVLVPCAHGARSSCAHVQPAFCSLSCPRLASYLTLCWAARGLGGSPWPYRSLSPLTLRMHVPGWGSPSVGLLCVGMCGCMRRISVSLVAGVCLCMCVHHWPGDLCQSQHGCPGRVWMWVVCKWGERVSVCECVFWNPTMYETPLG